MTLSKFIVTLVLFILIVADKSFSENWSDSLPQQILESILWKGDVEEGNLDDWEYSSFQHSGGGVFNTGESDVESIATSEIVHSGKFSVKATITNAYRVNKRAVRLMRWTDTAWDNAGELFPNEAYYSAWYYFPHNYNPNKDEPWDPGDGGWWNVFQFKSNGPVLQGPVWVLDVGHNGKDEGMYFYLYSKHNTPDGYNQPEPLPIPVKKWVHVEVFYKQSESKQGQVTVWQDGVQIFDLKNVVTSLGGPAHWGIGNYTDHITGGPVDGTATIFLDDALVSTMRVSSSISKPSSPPKPAITGEGPPTSVDGMFLHYPFDETPLDQSGNGNDGVHFGARRTTGLMKGAFIFDGADDYVSIKNLKFNSPEAIKTMTVSCWVSTSYSGNDPNGNWALLDFDRSEYFSVFIRGNDGRLGFSTTDSSGRIHDFFGDKAINDGQWHHVAVVYDGIQKILYVDGREDKRVVLTDKQTALGTGRTRFGFVGDGSEANEFNGQRNYIHYEGIIDELKFYSRPLSGSEILDAYQSIKIPDIDSNLIARYSFEQAASDSSKNGYHGNVYGPQSISSKVGKGYGFNGTNDYIAIQDLHFSENGEFDALSVCAWVNTSQTGGDWIDNWAILDFDRNEYFSLYVHGTKGTLGFSTTDSEQKTQDFFGNSPVNDGKWHYVCAVYDGRDKILYVDGKIDNITGNAHAGLRLGSGREARYGFIGDGSEAENPNGKRNYLYFNGALDEISLYKRALTTFEIKKYYASFTLENEKQAEALINDSDLHSKNTNFLSSTREPGHTLYEDAEDGKTYGWFSYHNGKVMTRSPGANASKHAIKTLGDINADGFRLGKEDGGDWNNEKEFIIEFSLLMEKPSAGVVYFHLQTSAGEKFLVYSDRENLKNSEPDLVHIELSGITDGNWHNIRRNLLEDLAQHYPSLKLLAVKSMFVYGSLSIDDVALKEF